MSANQLPIEKYFQVFLYKEKFLPDVLNTLISIYIYNTYAHKIKQTNTKLN